MFFVQESDRSGRVEGGRKSWYNLKGKALGNENWELELENWAVRLKECGGTQIRNEELEIRK
ncbi:MAG: hypothetical protein Q4C10_14135, partial [Clostridia bacterium]|nr:hypothetical protein [Clostridia bacterium]